MKLGIGIDTGGTYTDAVIYDFEKEKIMGSAKALTTRENLVTGILGALDALPQELVRQADMISLSTTLATNACVEDKSGRAKLIFFGGDREIINKCGEQYGLPPADEICIFNEKVSGEGTETLAKSAKKQFAEPDWEAFGRQLGEEFSLLDGVGIIEVNSRQDGAAIEKKAKKIFEEKYDVPVVCGHELFSELNSLQRGASTLLNAGLFPVIREFLDAVKKALAARKIQASVLVIVRSDGSLMSEEFAALHPVETLLCGPAASAVGCARLTDNPNSIMVDMGGTTTDIALLKDGVPVQVTEGVSIGRWKTFVNGLYIKTLGLGGDSAVHYKEKSLILEEYRVIPLCVAAQKYPSVVENLKKIVPRKHTRYLYEHYLLIKDISESSLYTDKEKAFCNALRKGPLPVTEAAKAIGEEIYTLNVDRLLKDGIVSLCGLTPTDMMHIKGDFQSYDREEAAKAIGEEIYTLNVDRLLKDGIVSLCGLTPTDMMHIKGDFQSYDREASLLGAKFAACNLEVTVSELCDMVYEEIKRRMYVNIVKALLENQYPHYMKNGVSPEVEQFICENGAAAGEKSGMLSLMLQTDFSLVGVGGPIGIFLEDVAKRLGTHAVIPENYQVANALGAIMGSINASASVEIRQEMKAEGDGRFLIPGSEGERSFETLEEAKEFAVGEAEKRARLEAEKRGAQGDISVTVTTADNSAMAETGAVYLGTVVTARAVGSVGF